jgi:hypothetical protein
MMVNSVGQTEEGETEVRGVILDKAVGPYAARIVAVSNMKKEIAVSGPAGIEYNKSTGEFVITLKTQGMEDLFYSENDPKVLEIYISRR